jgi:hypothetical protein
MKLRKSEWTDVELKQLAALVATGGSAFRAAAKFKRSISMCRNQARAIGAPFETLYVRRRNILAKCVAAERDLVR